jgi:hypothetical protein
VLRRIETYGLRPDAPDAAAARFLHALEVCGHHIPEVLESHVGRNQSDAPVHVVWEHAFGSPEAYRRYMVHPFHATVLDRYILQDSPECVVALDTFGAGLVGYRCEEASFRLDGGIRRLVLLRLDPQAAPAALSRVTAELTGVPGAVPGMAVSVVGANTLGPAWFDGETPVTGPPRWTHVWEQGFASGSDLTAYRGADVAVAAAERAGEEGWRRWSGGTVTRAAELVYAIDEPRSAAQSP